MKGRIAGRWIFTAANIMWHPPVWSIAAGFRSPVPLSPLLIFFCLKRRTTDFQCFSMGPTTPQVAPSRLGSRPPSNTWFLRPTQISPPNGISIGTARFCRAYERDQQTHKPRYSVCSNGPHLMRRVHATGPKKQITNRNTAVTLSQYRDGIVWTAATGAWWLLGNGRSEVCDLCFL